MKVRDIEQYLSDLARLMQATEAKKTAAGLIRIAEGLRPFREHELDAFAGFLGRAEEYHRSGILPVTGKGSQAGRVSTPKPKADTAAIRDKVKRMYGEAGSSGTTIEAIDAIGKDLQPLKKDELVEIARAIELVGMEKKTKAQLADQIVSRIRSIKQAAVRTSIFEKTGTT
jgi:hypothetical protein